MSEDYAEFLRSKTQSGDGHGFEPSWLPNSLFPFQRALVEWAVRRGRAAIFADCGLGKTAMQLVWAENVIIKTNRPVLVLTPLAVGAQTVREGHKFAVAAKRSQGGRHNAAEVVVTNYEKLHLFDSRDFAGVVCDESSILKSFAGKRRAEITEFLRTVPYRLLCTATAAPNDYTELGTSSEALGELGHMDMLSRFFKNEQGTCDVKGRWKGYGAPRHHAAPKWRFKGHAEHPFWRWVCSWARAVRRPSDLGFPDDGFALPPLIEREHVVESRTAAPGMLFALPAVGIDEEREERRRTVGERCEKVAALAREASGPVVIWCHLNDEADRICRILPEARQVSGASSGEERESVYEDFASGSLRVVVIKPKIGAWGLNWQFCNRVITFASHSYEQHYQAVRRCWRFGQEREVTVDLVATEGERGIKDNLRRKSAAADRMFASLVEHMNDALRISRSADYKLDVEVPTWL